jgi:hypothetical protein
MSGSLSVITPPTGSVVTVQQAINQGRIDDAADANLPLMIEAATTEIESYIGKSLRVQTLSWAIAQSEPPNSASPIMYYSAPLVFPIGLEYIMRMQGHYPIELPNSVNVTTVLSVTLQDWKGNTQALVLNTDYEVQGNTQPARIRLKNNLFGYNINTDLVIINYTTGYTTVPAGIILAILLLVTHKYRFRGDDLETGGSLPHQVKRALDPYRSISFGGG